MKTSIVYLFIFIFVSMVFAQWPLIHSQSDWHSGAGLTDTTGNWEFRYSTSGGINYATSPLMLLADPLSCIYTNWVSHTIDNSPEIGTFNWCVRTADINGDDIPDIVANLSDDADAVTARVVWYEGPATGWIYTRHDIYTYSPVTTVAGAFPADIDNDGDIDVVAADTLGLYWFENDGTGGGWTRHTIYPTAYDQYQGWYYDVADVDGDGWLDVMMTEVEIDHGFLFDNVYTYCTIYWNSGSGPDYFDWSGPAPGGNTLISGWGDGEGQFWRAVFFDADPADGFLDVAYERISYSILGGFDKDSLIIEVQNPARTFNYAYSHVIDAYSINMGHDGLWNNDFDGDGDEDLVVAVADNDCASISGCDDIGYFFLVQSDPGDAFSYHPIVDDVNSSYGDGAIMFDMDNDGMADIVGTCDSVGFFRRTGPLTTDFSLFPIDNIPGTGYTTHFASHWVYPYNMDRGECSGDADIDLLITFDNHAGDQELRIYENEMFSFVTAGSLYSAILGIQLPIDTCVTCSLYWEGCQIPEYTINVSGRMGASLAECQVSSWSAPSSSPFHETPSGTQIGEIHTPTDTLWVQYNIMVNRIGGIIDLSPLIDSVWVKIFTIPCECETIQAQWICPTPCNSYTSCAAQVMQVVLWTDSTTIDTNAVYFTISDGVNPPYPLSSSSIYISASCYDPPDCDSVFFEISGLTWTDATNVTITLDSAFTTDGCLTIFGP